MRSVIASAVVAVMLVALPARAQDPEKRVDFNFGGGWTATTGEVSNHLGSGYNINFGMTVNVNPKIGILAEYSYNGLGQKQVSLPVVGNPIAGSTPVNQNFFGDMNMQYGDFDVVFRPMPEKKASVYFMAGMGVYYRPVKVTTPALGYVPGYCDPFWYYCSPGGYVPVDKIVGSRSSTDFGYNIGGGVNFRLGESASAYVEMRYHYIWGPKYEVSGTSYDSNSAFFPLTFGIRF
jgi:opacity protein-like surface antigen